MALPAASHSRDLTDEHWLDRPDSSSLRGSAVSFVRRARDLMSTAPRDFEIPMLEGRGHAINFQTRYSAAFRLGPPRRHDRGDLGRRPWSQFPHLSIRTRILDPFSFDPRMWKR